MANITITTNNRPRALVWWHDLPENVQKDFDYLDPCERCQSRFVQYKGWWYDVYDTMPVRTSYVDELPAFKGWDSYESQGFFCGVLFRLVGDNEVICGRYVS
jgi:hypothetical protein